MAVRPDVEVFASAEGFFAQSGAVLPLEFVDDVVGDRLRISCGWIDVADALSLADRRVQLEEEIPGGAVDAEAWFELGRWAHRERNYTRAVACFEKALRCEPECSAAKLGMAAARLDGNDCRLGAVDWDRDDEAQLIAGVAAATAWIERRPQEPEAWFHRGAMRAIHTYQYDGGADWDEVLRIAPTSEFAKRILLHRAVDGAGKEGLERALELADAAAEIDPRDPHPWLVRGCARMAAGEADGAVEEFSEAVRRAPKHRSGWVARGDALRRAGSTAAALADFRQAAALHPSQAVMVAERLATWLSRAWERPGSWLTPQVSGDARLVLDAAIALAPQGRDLYFSRGALRQACGDGEGALADYTLALQNRPQSRSYLEARARLRTERGDYAGAVADFSKVLKCSCQSCQSTASRLNRAEAHERAGDREAALEDAAEAYRREPTLRTLLDRAEMWLRLGERGPAIADLQMAAAFTPENVYQFNRRAEAWRRAARVEEALADLAEAVRLHPKEADPLRLRARILMERREFREAVADCDLALALAARVAWESKVDADTTEIRARAKLELGDFHGAAADAREAIRLDPNPARYIRASRASQEAGDAAAALAVCDEGLKRHPDSYDLRRRQADVRAHFGDDGRALADADEAVRRRPDDADGYRDRGRLHISSGRWSAAAADYDAAIRLRPDDHHLYERRAFVRTQLGALDEATADAETAVLLAPGVAWTYHRRGWVRVARQLWAGGVEDFRRAIHLFPNEACFHSGLGRCQVARKAWAAAEAAYSEALRLQPGEAEYHGWRAIARRNREDWVGCLEDLRFAAETWKTAPEAWRRLASVRASAPDATVRDGAKAVENARQACELWQWKEPRALQTLAAAHAEAGDFAEAVLRQRKAVALFTAAGQDEWLPWANARLRDFLAKRPSRLRTCDAP